MTLSVVRPGLKQSFAAIVFAGCYLMAARFGLEFAIPPGNATAVWPASGFALVAVLLFGRWMALGVLAGATLAAMTTGVAFPIAFAIGIGNALEALIGAQLVGKFVGPKSEFRRSKHAFSFLFAAAIASLVAASVGVASLLAGGLLTTDQFASNWFTWWLGDMAGVIIVAPLLLAWRHYSRERPKETSLLRVVVVMAPVLAASIGVFCGVLPDRFGMVLLSFPLLLLIWLALRFGLREVTLATMIFSAAAIWAASKGVGVFSSAAIGESLISLQTFMILYATTGLVLAGLVARRRDTEVALRLSRDHLETAVKERTAELVRSNDALRTEIKERVSAEQTLAESEARFRTLFEQAGESIMLINPDGRIVDVNKRACSILGYSCDELLNLNVGDIEPTCSRESFLKIFEGLEYGVPAIVERTYRRKDGELLPVELSVGLVEVDGGVHAICLARDISERRRIEQKERSRQTTVLKSIGESIVITDADGLIQYVNPAFENTTGWSHHEVAGKNPRILKSGMHGREFYRDMWRAISKGIVWKGSFVDKKKDGTQYNVDATIAPIIEDSGEVAGYVAVSRDVTQQIRSETALRESDARMRAIVGTAVDGIVTIDDEGIIESCNPSARRIFSCSQDELVGKAASEFLLVNGLDDDSESLQKYVYRAAERLAGSTREVLAIRKDGSTFPADLSVSEVLLHDRRLFTGIIRDVSERHIRLAAEKRLLVTQQEMQVARSIQQRFFPSEAPTIEGFDIAGASWPADDTGGDYFDFLPFSNGYFGVVVADASGHGLGAALLMSETRAYLRALLSISQEVGDLATRLNSFLCEDCDFDKFVTFFLARIGVVDRSLVYAGAGHQCYLLRRTGEVEVLRATGIPLGFMLRDVPSAPQIVLEDGDLVLLLTDGFEETVSPEGSEFGRERVFDFVEKNRHKPAHEIVEILKDTVKAFAEGAPQHDDVTAVVVKVEKT